MPKHVSSLVVLIFRMVSMPLTRSETVQDYPTGSPPTRFRHVHGSVMKDISSILPKVIEWYDMRRWMTAPTVIENVYEMKIKEFTNGNMEWKIDKGSHA